MWFTAKFLLKYVQYNQEELLLRRKLLLFGTVLFLLLGSSLVVSVDAALMWSRTYEGAEIDIAYSLVATSDGGYALAGSMFVKTDELGDLEWNKTYGGIACSLVATSDGGYALAGANYSTATNYDFWLAKTDALGNIQWNRTYGGTGEDVAYSLVASTDGGYVLAGDTWSFGDGGADFWLVKTDANGVVEWNRMYGGAGDDCARALVATSDGGYAIAGIWNCATSYPLYNVGYYEGGDFWLVKTDALGIMQWNKTYGGTGGDLAFSLVTTSDGGYALAGTWDYIMAFFEGTGNADFWLVKTDALGTIQWSQTYGGTREDLAYSLVAASDGGYALAGVCNFTGPFGQGTADAWLVKTDSLGNMQWNKTYDGTGNNWGDDWACSVIATSDGGYALAGTAFYANYLDLEYGQQLYGDFWFVKTDELGVVPEYSSWLVPALVLTATAFIIVNKKRLLHKRL
jgi:hypothetical protein